MTRKTFFPSLISVLYYQTNSHAQWPHFAVPVCIVQYLLPLYEKEQPPVMCSTRSVNARPDVIIKQNITIR